MRHMSTRPAEKVDKDENKDQADKGRKTVSIAGQGAGSIVGFFRALLFPGAFRDKKDTDRLVGKVWWKGRHGRSLWAPASNHRRRLE